MTDFWSTQNTFAELLPSDEKRSLAESEETFDVVGVKLGNTNDYGPTWFVDIMLDKRRYAIAFGPNETRDQQYTDMQTFFRDNPGVGIPCRLVPVNTKSGFTAYVLQPPKQGNAEEDLPLFTGDVDEPPF